MATGGYLTSSDEPEIYFCPVCMEHLLNRNPRFLSCHHYFCQPCLQKQSKIGQVSCPTCRLVTKLPNNDVTKLAMNFPLLEVMERDKQITLEKEKARKDAGQCCHFCNKEKASYSCTDCQKFLCHDCKIKHKKMNVFQSHKISKLCLKHMDGISHVCMQCVQALCVKCIQVDHETHEDKVKEYTKGVKILLLDLEMMNTKLKEKNNIIRKRKEENDIQKNDILKERKQLQQDRQDLMKKIKEIDNKLHNVTVRETKCDDDAKMYRELSNKLNSSSRSVDKLLMSENEQLMASFQKQRISVEQLLSETEEFKAPNNSEVTGVNISISLQKNKLTSDIGGDIERYSYGLPSRPSSSGPSPDDIKGRGISAYEGISAFRWKTKGTSGIESSIYSSSYSRHFSGSQDSNSLSGDDYIPAGRKSSILQTCDKHKTINISDTGSSSLKTGKKSTSLSVFSKYAYSPEKHDKHGKHDKHEKSESETVESLLYSHRNYYEQEEYQYETKKSTYNS